MTREQLQNEAIEFLEDLGPVGARTFTRVNDALNRKYREALSSIGMANVTRQTVTASTVIGDRTVTFALQNIFSITNPDLLPSPSAVLREVSYDELLKMPLQTDPAREYAIQSMGASTVTVKLSCTPASIYSLSAEGEAPVALLAPTDVPVLPANFHGLLVWGALADVLALKNPAIADECQAKYDAKMNDLRFYIAKTRRTQMYQGKHREGRYSVPLMSS